MTFQTNALPMAIRERAAARLVKFAGLGLDTVFFINSGAEANENALKLAFKITGRTKAVALEQGWHGRTAAAGAGAVTWGALEKWYGFPRRPFDVAFAPRDVAQAAEDAIDRDTAAVIVEPVQGVGGAYDIEARARGPAPSFDLRSSPMAADRVSLYARFDAGDGEQRGRDGWPHGG